MFLVNLCIIQVTEVEFNGLVYSTDKSFDSKVYWRCKDRTCKGRVVMQSSVLVEFSTSFNEFLPNSAKWSVDEMVSRRNGQSAKWSVVEMVFDETSRIRSHFVNFPFRLLPLHLLSSCFKK